MPAPTWPRVLSSSDEIELLHEPGEHQEREPSILDKLRPPLRSQLSRKRKIEKPVTTYADNLPYYAGIMLNAFVSYYAQNYAGIICQGLAWAMGTIAMAKIPSILNRRNI